MSKAVANGGQQTIPASVTRAEMLAALKPMLELLGLPENVLMPGLRVDYDAIHFTVAGERVEGGSVGLAVPVNVDPSAHHQASIWSAQFTVPITNEPDA